MIDEYIARSIETPKRLRSGVEAVCPTDPITFSDVPIIEGRVNFRPEKSATKDQIAAAQAFIATFDWSPEATQEWIESKEPHLKAAKDNSAQMVVEIDAFLAAASKAEVAELRAEAIASALRQKTLIQAVERLAGKQ